MHKFIILLVSTRFVRIDFLKDVYGLRRFGNFPQTYSVFFRNEFDWFQNVSHLRVEKSCIVMEQEKVAQN